MFKSWYRWMLIGLIVISIILAGQQQTDAATAFVTMKIGSEGNNVIDLQQRLRMLGYLTAQADGKFGTQTASAVKRFQRGAGIIQNGIVGQTTMHALKKVTVSRADLSRLARIVNAESRGESFTGQVAVAVVVLNRVQSPKFPNSIEEVIFAKGAFSTVSGGQYWLMPDETAFKAAIKAAKGSDPSNGALYFSSASTQSEWFQSMTVTATIGNHVFVK
ncbi:cell wall hydrolase [Paenibacillus xylaniclasticus]|uniref:cell wall hydrolase n=1 Tax=Paenibacillus xylaniclasticus TaxID=588083 RepID=UPI001FE7A4A1|nr:MULTISPECIES: cell wall hydrolase [Paenibacillus]